MLLEQISVLILSSVFLLTQAQVPPFEEICETNKWPADKANLVPTFVVNLDLPPQQRWVEISKAYKPGIRNMIQYVKKFIVEFNPKFQKLVELIENDLSLLVPTFPAPYGDEMIGIADAIEMPLGDVVLYNIFYEIFTVCTSIVSQDSNGHMLHARNLDFGLLLGWDLKNNTWIISELLRPVTINVNFTRNGKLQYITSGFAGFIGVFTGVKPNKFSITMNERFAVKGGFIGLFEWIFDINRNQSWSTFLPRDLFEKEDMTYSSVVTALANTPLMAPCYYIVAGPESGNGAVVTRDREKAADVWTLDEKTWFLAETNYDHWEKPLLIDDRITPCNNCMNKMGQANATIGNIYNVLSSKPVLNKLTVYTALMDVKTGHVETYIQNCHDPCWPW